MPQDYWGRIVYILQTRGMSYLDGAKNTMIIAVISTLIGCIIGFAVGIVQTIPVSKKDNIVKRAVLFVVRLILNIYVEVFRGTPMMAQAMFIYFGSAAVFNINMSMWFAAFFIVSINTGAYMAETVRGGILSIDPGQTEGAKAIGMTHVQTMLHVILPQALRNIMPQIGNNLIINIKDTCVLSVIGIVELFYATKSVAGALYTYFEAFTIAMVMYFVLTFACSRLLRLWEKKLDGADNYDLATTDTLAHTSGLYNYPGETAAEPAAAAAEAAVTAAPSNENLSESASAAGPGQLDAANKSGNQAGEEVIRIRHLSKTFGKNVVLRDIDFSVSTGDVTCIIGASGSGKSTLLRCINLLETPTSGEIFYHGADIAGPKTNAAAYRARVGMVFQNFNLFNNMTVLDNCMVGQTKVLKKDKTVARESALFYLEKVGMGPYINAKPRQLSGGQKQRVAIARALAMEPELLLFDEPTSALDPQMVGEVLDVMKRLVQEGLTMIIVTHEMAFARDVSNHVVYMADGIIEEEGTPAQIFGSPKNPKTVEFLSRFRRG